MPKVCPAMGRWGVGSEASGHGRRSRLELGRPEQRPPAEGRAGPKRLRRKYMNGVLDPFAFVCPASIDLVLALFCSWKTRRTILRSSDTTRACFHSQAPHSPVGGQAGGWAAAAAAAATGRDTSNKTSILNNNTNNNICPAPGRRDIHPLQREVHTPRAI